MKKLVLLMMTIITAVAMLAAGCGGEEKQTAKVLRVATNPTFAPFEYQEEGKKEYSGFDMDLIRALGKQMGYQVEIQSMGFDALIPALNAHNIDVAISGMSINEERKKAVLFAEPYYTSGLIIVVAKDNESIKNLDDLQGKRIACQIGTTGEKVARMVAGGKVKAFNHNTEATLELKTGGTDAVINDVPVVKYYLAQGGDEFAKTVGEVMNAEQYGIAMHKDNTALAAEMNKAMAELKANGEFDKIYAKWFGEAK